MGEAMSEGGVFAHAKARALLEVVRLAFEGGIGFGSEMTDASCAATADDGEASNAAAICPSRQKARTSREYAQPQLHPPHRPASTGSSSRLVPGGPCMWCGVTATPQWRRPRGTNKLLCNACGIFFTRYGRLPEKSQHAHVGSVHTLAAPGDVATVPAGTADLSMEYSHLGHVDSPQQEPDGGTLERCTLLVQRARLQQQPTGSTSSLASASPHKRKDAPQPEAELLRCMEDSAGSTIVDTAASPALTPLGSLTQPVAPQQPAPVRTRSDQQCLPQEQPEVAAASPRSTHAAPEDQTTSTVLTVAPLDLGFQHFGMQQMGLLGQPMVGLAALPSLCLNGSAAAPCGTAASCGSGHAAMMYQNRTQGSMSMLPPELMGRPFSLPAGLLPGGVALLDAAAAASQPPARPLYARAPKRQERLPAGESEDSNISTDSHTATHGDAGNSHDEDEGGTTTTATTTSTVAALGGLSCSPPAMPSLHLSSALFALPTTVPLLSGVTCCGSPLALPPLGGGGGAGSFAAGFAASGSVPVATAPVGEDHGQLQLQQHQPVIFLHARRSKGPRSRASSATPSSSTQS